MSKGILLVHVGTSHAAAREKTLDVLRREMEAAFPQRRVYEAWTGSRIREKVREREGILRPGVAEAVEAIAAGGVEELVVQPTHLIPGVEYESMRAGLTEARGRIPRILWGEVLLSSRQDREQVIRSAMAFFLRQTAGEGRIREEMSSLPTRTALVWLGHGSTGPAGELFGEMNRLFRELGYPRTYLAGVKEDLREELNVGFLIRELRRQKVGRVYLAPFMVAAGHHAGREMFGEAPDSWRSRLEAAGFSVVCCRWGLGEDPAIRGLFIRHAQIAEFSGEAR